MEAYDYDDFEGDDDDFDDDDDYDEVDDLLGHVDDLLGVDWGRRRSRSRGRGRGRVSTGRRGRRGRRGRTLALSPRVGAVRVLAKPPLIPPAPGVPAMSKLYIPLGLGSFTFVNAGVTANTFSENPQKPVRPRRMWLDIVRTAGAAGIAVVVNDIKIGVKSMLGGIASVPASQFGPGAFAQHYNMFDSAVPGVNVSVLVALSATPPVGETVTVSISFDCDSLG